MIAIRASTYRTTSRLVRLGVAFFKTAMIALTAVIITGAWFTYIVIPGIVKEAEYREARFAISHAHRCGKNADLVRGKDGKWICVKHNFGG